jgi:Holliday junction resolvase
MGKRSREKGKRGERELSKALIDVLGINARRGRQFSGSPDSPDIITSLSGIHFECKRVERFQLYPSLEQSASDSGDEIPVVAHRKNRKPWVISMYLEDLPELCRIINEQSN